MEDVTGRYVIVFNGEIYNYHELRQDYETRGACLRTQSDTEVLLEGFKLKGEAVCSDLNGMFAFAIWDKKDRRLFLARDHLGKKPLYWTLLEGRLHFASTLDAFRSLPGWQDTLEPAVLDMMVRHNFLPLRHTVYKGAFALPPGSFAWAEPERPEPVISCYWRPRFRRGKPMAEAEALDAYEELLCDAVRIRLRADVPLALTFSGGVDSGTIAALAAKRLNVSLTCFCIDYHTADDPSLETEIALRTAQHLGLPIVPIQFDYHQELLPLLAQAYRYFDQPTCQLPITYSLLLYRAIKPGATVALGGAGGDELFCGYNGNEHVLKAELARRGLRRLPDVVLRRLPEALAWRLPCLRDIPSRAAAAYYGCDPVSRAIAADLLEAMRDSDVEGPMDLLMFMGLFGYATESNYRLPDILGLQEQVEVRAPFLDHRLVEFAAALPPEFKSRPGNGLAGNKWLPKRLYERYVPTDIAWATKKGMGYNIRFDRSFVDDPAYEVAFEANMQRIESKGLPTEAYRDAYSRYREGKRRNMEEALPCGNVMASAFMLGAWLSRDNEAV